MHAGSHMHVPQSIPGTFPVQEALLLCSSVVLPGLLLLVVAPMRGLGKATHKGLGLSSILLTRRRKWTRKRRR